MTKLEKIRRAVADYMSSEGCSCCRDEQKHRIHATRLALLLDVPEYKDGSGFDFYQFKSKPPSASGDSK